DRVGSLHPPLRRRVKGKSACFQKSRPQQSQMLTAGETALSLLHCLSRSCVARQEPYIPGALSILKGTVPGRVRGSGHMVPTYFRRELRDRVLQRRLRPRTSLQSLCLGDCWRHAPLSAERPVSRGFSTHHDRSSEYWITCFRG